MTVLCLGVASCAPNHAATDGRPSARSDLQAPVNDFAVHTLRREGFTPERVTVLSMVGVPRIDLFQSVCTGSADGHCGSLDAFRGRTHIWHRDLVNAAAVTLERDGFVVRARGYRPGDPLCCPSGGVTLSRYRWNGATFKSEVGHRAAGS